MTIPISSFVPVSYPFLLLHFLFSSQQPLSGSDSPVFLFFLPFCVLSFLSSLAFVPLLIVFTPLLFFCSFPFRYLHTSLSIALLVLFLLSILSPLLLLISSSSFSSSFSSRPPSILSRLLFPILFPSFTSSNPLSSAPPLPNQLYYHPRRQTLPSKRINTPKQSHRVPARPPVTSAIVPTPPSHRQGDDGGGRRNRPHCWPTTAPLPAGGEWPKLITMAGLVCPGRLLTVISSELILLCGGGGSQGCHHYVGAFISLRSSSSSSLPLFFPRLSLSSSSTSSLFFLLPTVLSLSPPSSTAHFSPTQNI